jgi:hypothetical protein
MLPPSLAVAELFRAAGAAAEARGAVTYRRGRGQGALARSSFRSASGGQRTSQSRKRPERSPEPDGDPAIVELSNDRCLVAAKTSSALATRRGRIRRSPRGSFIEVRARPEFGDQQDRARGHSAVVLP